MYICPECKETSSSDDWNTATEQYWNCPIPYEGRIENVIIKPFKTWTFTCPHCHENFYDRNFIEIVNRSHDGEENQEEII